MVEGLLTAIHDAEARAEKILDEANKKAAQIHETANTEIAQINRQTENSVTRAVTAAHEDILPIAEREPIIVPADPKKITVAKNLILDEFKRRFVK